MSQLRRDWSRARQKVELEGRCRNCGSGANLEAAHVIGRVHDKKPPLRYADSLGRSSTLLVEYDRVIPLCRDCHVAEHRGELDTLPLLRLDEQLQAVADAGGIEQARVRLCPSAYRRDAA